MSEALNDGVDPVIFIPEYLSTQGNPRSPTMIETRVHNIFEENADRIQIHSDSESMTVRERFHCHRQNGIGSSVILTRTIENNSKVSKIEIAGLNGFSGSRGLIWSDQYGTLWHQTYGSRIKHYPLVKIPLLITRLYRLHE